MPAWLAAVALAAAFLSPLAGVGDLLESVYCGDSFGEALYDRHHKPLPKAFGDWAADDEMVLPASGLSLVARPDTYQSLEAEASVQHRSLLLPAGDFERGPPLAS